MIKPYYDEDGIVIYNADCREVLGQFADKSFDLVLTDPPYGVTQNKWDSFDFIPQWWLQMKRLAKNAVVMTAQQPFTSDMVIAGRDWFKWADVWHKTQSRGFLNAKVMPLREHEDILVFGPGRVTYNPQFAPKDRANIRPVTPRTKLSDNYGSANLEWKREQPNDVSFPRSVVKFENSQEGQHPTQKPLALFAYLLKTYANSTDVILDPFLGSGTTLHAAKNLGLKAVGVEINRAYCDIAIERLRQQVLFTTEAA